MNKGNRSVLLGGAAGVVTIGALAFASTSGSGGALLPAAGGTTPTATATSSATPSETSTGTPSATSTASSTSSASSPSSTHTATPKPTASPTTTADPGDTDQHEARNGYKPWLPSVTVTNTDGYKLHAYPGYCTPPQSEEHLRTMSYRLTFPEEPKVWGWTVKVVGSGDKAEAYFAKTVEDGGGGNRLGAVQWHPTSLNFSINVYAHYVGDKTTKVLSMGPKDAANFANKVSRWCDAKGTPDAPKPPQGHGTDQPSGLPTGPRVQTG